MSGYPRHIKRQLREWMVESYERELKRELLELEQSFSEWREGKISSGELSHRVHKYDVGPSRDLFSRYNNLRHELNVAYAVATGILREDEVPAELLEAIAGPLTFYRSLKESGELKAPGAE